MTQPTDLPGALPIAIAAALAALILAPWLGDSEAEACTGTTQAAASSVGAPAPDDCD